MSTDAELIERLRRWVACPNPYDTAQEAADRLSALIAERGRLKEALDLCMIGGNHLATVLIGRLGASFPEKYPVGSNHDVVIEAMTYGDPYEVWCCWDAIMRARAALSPIQEKDLVQPAAVLSDGQCDHPVSEWQPIETAPKDGSEILLSYPGRVTVGHWTTDEECRETIGDCGGECRCPEYEYHAASWLSWDGGFTEELPPTHWMPFPASPPASEDGE